MFHTPHLRLFRGVLFAGLSTVRLLDSFILYIFYSRAVDIFYDLTNQVFFSQLGLPRLTFLNDPFERD